MTLRTFRNPEVPGPQARSVKIGDVVIEPGQTGQVELPKLTVFRRSGDVWGEIDQSCPDLLEEVNAPAGLVFDLDAGQTVAQEPVKQSAKPAPAAPATDPAED